MRDTRTGPSYNVALLKNDLAAKGWLPTDLAKRAKVSDMTVSRFLTGERRTARTAKKLATALGYKIRRYLVPVRVTVSEQLVEGHQ